MTEQPRMIPLAIVLSLYFATAVGTGLLAFLYSSAVPGLPWSEDCGMQFLGVLPLSVALLVTSVPAVIAADHIGIRGFLKWYSPVAGLLSFSAWVLDTAAIQVPIVAALVLWVAISAYGFVAVPRVLGRRRRST